MNEKKGKTVIFNAKIKEKRIDELLKRDVEDFYLNFIVQCFMHTNVNSFQMS